MQRVNIVGCPGAGKSTLARKIAAHTGLPVFHLDRIYHDSSRPYQNKDIWQAHIAAIVERPAWIIDGVHQTTYEARFRSADLTIFLDLPFRVCMRRVVMRWLANRNKYRPDMPPDWRERLGVNFLLFVITYRRKERPAVYAALQKHAKENQIIVLRTPADVDAFLSEQGLLAPA